MLSFLDRSNRSRGGVLRSRRSPASTTTTTSSFCRESLQASSNKDSLRDRLRGLKGNIIRSFPKYNQTRTAHVPGPWYNTKSNDDLLYLGPPNAHHVEVASRTWPAIRKSISSIALSFRASRATGEPCRSPDQELHQSTTSYSRGGFRVSQESIRRWATVATHIPPVASRHFASWAGYSGLDTTSEVVPGQNDEPAPQLPGLAESSDFLESINDTGLFRICTPLSEDGSIAETIKVRHAASPCRVASTGRARSVRARLPVRFRSPDALCHKATGYPVSDRVKGRHRSSRADVSISSNVCTEDSAQAGREEPRQQQTASKGEGPRACGSSRHPVEWLDRILETSYATRNPISPKLCVSRATMEFLRKSKTCIFVEFPRHGGLPEPLRYYPGFRAALEDICDRFGDYYAPFAAYNAHTRVITLYATGAPRPGHRFIDEDTAIFDLELARSAWVGPKTGHAPSTGIAHSSEIPEKPTKAPGRAQDDGENTRVTAGEEDPAGPREPEV